MAIAMLKLECIGDDQEQHLRSIDRLARSIGLVQDRGPSLSPWVSEICGRSRRFKYEREFLHGRKDYSQANSVGSRGIYLWFDLHEGVVYEVYERMSWKRSRRYFCTARDGLVVELSNEEVGQWLDAR